MNGICCFGRGKADKNLAPAVLATGCCENVKAAAKTP